MTFAVGNAAWTLGTVSQDLTIAGLGWTPKAIILFTSTGTQFGIGAHAVFSCCMADDAGNVRRWGLSSQNALEVTDTSRFMSTSGAMIMTGASQATTFAATVDSDDATAGPIANGWRVDITDAPEAAFQEVVFVLIGEDDDAEPWDADAGGNVTLAAAPAAMLAMANGAAVSASVRSGVLSSIGVSDGTNNACVGMRDSDALETTDIRGAVLDDGCAAQVDASVTWRTALGSFQSGAPQADLTVTGSAGVDDVVGMAIYLGAGKSAWVGVVDSPTNAAVDWVVAPAGLAAITPEIAILLPSMLSATGTVDSTGLGATMGVGIHDGTRQHCIAVAMEDGQTISDTQSAWAAKWIDWYSDDGVATHDIAPASTPFELGGWTVDAADIAATDGTARKWPVLVIGATAGGGGGGSAGCCADGFMSLGVR